VVAKVRAKMVKSVASTMISLQSRATNFCQPHVIVTFRTMRDKETPTGLLDPAQARTRCGWFVNTRHIITNNVRPAPIDGLDLGATVHDAVKGAFHLVKSNDFRVRGLLVIVHQV
jgi:hypothetical protein